MDVNEIKFRMLRQESKVFLDVETVLDVHWIDEMIKEELVHCLFQPIVTATCEIYGYGLFQGYYFGKPAATPL